MFSCAWLFVTPWIAAYQASCPSLSPRVCTNACPFIQWCHPTISSSVIPFSFCLQSFPASGSFPRSQFFTSGGQSIRVSASASVLSVNIQGWFPSGLTGLISLQSKGLSRVFSNPAVQKHQFFGAQFSQPHMTTGKKGSPQFKRNESHDLGPHLDLTSYLIHYILSRRWSVSKIKLLTSLL